MSQQGLVLLDFASLLSHAPQLELADLAGRLDAGESSRLRLLSLLSVAAAGSLHFAGVELAESASRVRVQLLDEFDIKRAWEARQERHMQFDSPRSKQASAAVRAAAAASAAAAEVAATPTAAAHGPMQVAKADSQPVVRRTATGHRVTAARSAAGSAYRSAAPYRKIADGSGLHDSLVLPEPDELDAIMTHLKILMQRECRTRFVKPVRQKEPADGLRSCSAHGAFSCAISVYSSSPLLLAMRKA